MAIHLVNKLILKVWFILKDNKYYKSMDKIYNLGEISMSWLKEIGITNLEQLKKVGSIEAYKIIKEIHPDRVSLNLLWGLESAIRGIHWKFLSQKDKNELLKKI